MRSTAQLIQKYLQRRNSLPQAARTAPAYQAPPASAPTGGRPFVSWSRDSMHVDCRRKLELAEDLLTFCPPGSAGAVLAEKLRVMAWANVPDGYDAVVRTVTLPEAAALLTSTNPAEIRRFQTWETWFHKQAPTYPSVVGRMLQQLPDRWRAELHVAAARLNAQMSCNPKWPSPPTP